MFYRTLNIIIDHYKLCYFQIPNSWIKSWKIIGCFKIGAEFHPLPISILQNAPEYWRSLDPSWKGTGPPMHRYFHPNGYHTADTDGQVWGGHGCTYSIMRCYVGEGQIRDHYVRINRWPPMAISRNEDWSWEMSNHLYCYNCVPDAAKEGDTGPLFPAWY